MALTKRTPCVGICSTTYGDLVCRGCKRFAHEIVQWNAYDVDQQTTIWQRLHQLRDEVVAAHLVVDDVEKFKNACAKARCPDLDGAALMYELMRYLVSVNASLLSAGLRSNSADDTALASLQAIDAEIYTRSVAHYERNFKIPV